MYYLMVSYRNTRENAEEQFRKLFKREPDEVIRDHNYWWLGKITEKEVTEMEKSGRKAKIIEERNMP